jgi:uncharacterized protein YndB with AHSA1/START domain
VNDDSSRDLAGFPRFYSAAYTHKQLAQLALVRSTESVVFVDLHDEEKLKSYLEEIAVIYVGGSNPTDYSVRAKLLANAVNDLSRVASPKATLQLSMKVNAPVKEVFAAWADPVHARKWFPCAALSQDFVVGGNYHLGQGLMQDGSFPSSIYGTFQQIEMGKKLVYTWNASIDSERPHSTDIAVTDTFVTVKFVDLGRRTEVFVEHSGLQSAQAASYRKHWTHALERLSRYFAPS